MNIAAMAYYKSNDGLCGKLLKKITLLLKIK